jgi:Xaa-Pro aminopeptidase
MENRLLDLLLPPVKDQDSPVFAEVSQMPREALYLPARDPRQERWTGVKIGPSEEGLREKTGFAVVRNTSLFEADLRKAVTGFGRIYTVLPLPCGADSEAAPGRAGRLERLSPLAEIGDARPAITDLRVVKSPGEIGLIQKATDATIAAHLAAWKRATPGLYEYQVAAAMMGVFFDHGCHACLYAGHG